MSAQESVILLHGLWMGPWVMGWISHHLMSEGYAVRALSLNSMSDSPDAHVDRLAKAVEEAECQRVHLLGHSLGGVVSLRYLQEREHVRVGRCLLMGVPALGCQAARQLDLQPWGALLGTSRELWFSPFAPSVPEVIEVGAIAGNHAFGLGPLFTHLDGPSDGVVTIDETRIAGLKDHIVLEVSHTAMLFSTEVANQAAAFLKRGSFQR